MTAKQPTSLQQQLQSAIEAEQLTGRLKVNEPMSHYTTWRIGGEAECLYQPKDVADLQTVLKMLPAEIEVRWLGLGSNLLVRDGGLKGLVIITNGVLNDFRIHCHEQDDNSQCVVFAQCGVPCAIFSRKAAKEGINGAEFLSGIPGTIGGALAMNAGAFGGETWHSVMHVEMINRQGEITTRNPGEFAFGYRHVNWRQKTAPEWFLSGTFMFAKDEHGLVESKRQIKRLLEKRAETQPTKQPNAGSVFKNPENDYAARLIESCGLKGTSVNDAQVSEKHANFIINTGQASASDVEELIHKIQQTVWRQHGVALETEVRIIGERKQ